jgi:hypothetical protein
LSDVTHKRHPINTTFFGHFVDTIWSRRAIEQPVVVIAFASRDCCCVVFRKLVREIMNAVFFTAKATEVESEECLLGYARFRHFGMDDLDLTDPASTDALVILIPYLLGIVGH